MAINRLKLLFFAFLSFLFIKGYSQQDTVTIVIMHTNDMHAKIDRFPRIAYLVDSIRKVYPEAYLVSAGDLFTGNPVVDKYSVPGEPMIDLMNHVGYQLSAIGNHEFDISQKYLNRAFIQADFPFICANINTKHGKLHQPLPYYKFKTSQGVTIGFLGLIELEKNGYPASNPLKLKGLKFYDPVRTVKKYESYKDSADVFILLSHLGVETDKLIARKYPGLFDAIIGGHSHTLLPDGVRVGDVLVTQAGSYLRYLGVLTIKVYNGRVVYKADTVLSIKHVQKYDKDIAALVQHYDDMPQFNKVIGYLKKDITGKSALGELIADAMLDTLHCDIAFQNIGGVRVHRLPAGKITVKQIYEMQPFNDVYVIYRLNVRQIKHLIRYAYNLEKTNDLLVAGIKIVLYVDKDKNLKKVKLYDYQGNEIKRGSFTVAVNDYIAAAYTIPCMRKKHINTGIIDADATINYLRKNSPLDYSGGNRVKVISM